MTRTNKIIRNAILLVVLFLLFMWRSGLYFTPLSAHESSERSIHYGPSEVVHVEDFDKGKYILCRYDRWISCNTVNRALFFLWRFGNQPTGFEYDATKPIDYTWGSSYQYYKLYGIINDNRVEKIEITLGNGTVLAQTEFYDGLFLFTWKAEDNDDDFFFKGIRAFDSEGKIIFQEEK